ncbi:MAG: glycosyltransferase [Cyclobacteriaceae bacterium]|jgi:hypothetical protein|nr:glycosyltransferase [Cyclobacteriaceae bacterium]
MKKILILAYSDLRHDARVARQVDFLSEGNQLTIACFNSPQEWPHEVFHIERIRPTYLEKAISSLFLLTNQFESAYRVLYDFPKFRSQIKDRAFDLIVANDIESLPLAFKIKGKEKILFDAHEYAPRHFEDKFVWRIFFQRFNKYLCKKYLPKVDKMITVGEGLAKEYAKHYPVDPIVVTNANYLSNHAPSKVDPNKIKLIHHGAANPSRQLEIMIEMMNHLAERFSLDLMLLSPSTANKKTRDYLTTLKNMIKDNPNINIIPPVKSSEVVASIHHYDIGIFLLPPINFNYANTLPNKFFDFVQARLCIAIGPTPEMAALVNTYDLGVISDDFTAISLAKKINALTGSDIARFKEQSNKAAMTLSAEQNKVLLKNIVTKLLNE